MEKTGNGVEASEAGVREVLNGGSRRGAAGTLEETGNIGG
jgi:hypothetical protein